LFVFICSCQSVFMKKAKWMSGRNRLPPITPTALFFGRTALLPVTVRAVAVTSVPPTSATSTTVAPLGAVFGTTKVMAVSVYRVRARRGGRRGSRDPLRLILGRSVNFTGWSCLRPRPFTRHAAISALRNCIYDCELPGVARLSA
jgi:hypothetical protein